MPGLVPGIHVVPSMPNGVDGRDQPGHDDLEAGERKTTIVKCDSPRGGPNGDGVNNVIPRPDSFPQNMPLANF